MDRRQESSRKTVIWAALALAPCLAAAGGASYHPSIDSGRTLYMANCVGCHGVPPNNMVINNLVAANRPDLIRYQILTNPEMEFLALTDNQLTDIATYLAYPVTTDADCIFGWGEAVVLPNLMTPRTASQSAYGYYYRYYPPAQIYVATAQSAFDGTTHLYYLDAKSNQGILDLGDDSQHLSLALAAGCP